MSAECFIDTNVFIYQIEARDERKADIAASIIRGGIETGNACATFSSTHARNPARHYCRPFRDLSMIL